MSPDRTHRRWLLGRVAQVTAADGEALDTPGS